MRHSTLVRCLCRVYSALLYAYPREFRLRYGAEMAQLFRDRCRALAQTQGPRGLLRFGARSAVDWLTTTIREGVDSMRAADPSTVRFALLAGITLSLALMSIKIFFYRPLLAIPGGPAYIAETAAVLLLYAMLVFWATRGSGPVSRNVLLSGATLGLVAAVVEIAHLASEDFVQFGPPWDAITALTSMFVTFLIWGAAGYRSARSAGSVAPSILAGCWTAIVTTAILVPFALALEFYWTMPKPEYVVTWGEFQRSGWTDVHAFTIANTLESALEHMVESPLIGAIFGGFAGALTRIPRKRQPGATVAHA